MHLQGSSYKWPETTSTSAGGSAGTVGASVAQPAASWGPRTSLSASEDPPLQTDNMVPPPPPAGGAAAHSSEGKGWCTFSTNLPNKAYCIFVRVDPQFWLLEKHHRGHLKTNLVLDQLKAYYENYLNENDRFRMLMNNSVLAIGRKMIDLRTGELEEALHGWLLKAITSRCNTANIIMGNSHHYPWRPAANCQRPLLSNSGAGAAPTFFAGWHTTAPFPIIGFVSDWYESLTTNTSYQRALLAAGRTATECLLASPSYGSCAVGTAASATSTKISAQSVNFERPRFCCFLVCTRHFAQFGAAHQPLDSTPSQIDLLLLSKRLQWGNKRDRRRMAQIMLGISYWLKRTASR